MAGIMLGFLGNSVVFARVADGICAGFVRNFVGQALGAETKLVQHTAPI